MAMPQRDDLIEEIKRTDLLLEWAVQHIRPRRRRRVARRSAVLFSYMSKNPLRNVFHFW